MFTPVFVSVSVCVCEYLCVRMRVDVFVCEDAKRSEENMECDEKSTSAEADRLHARHPEHFGDLRRAVSSKCASKQLF